jgi:fermentation-respiration switch protein FrsA (DUF1100 family)
MPSMTKALDLALLVALALGVSACNGLFYFPSQRVYSVPRAEHRDIVLRAADGVELHAWYFPPANGGRPLATVVQFHGNAGNISSHHRSLSWIVHEGYALFTFDYRGFGSSAGRPSRPGLHLDALAVLEWALEEAPSGARPRDVVLYGQSLGGAVLLRALAEVSDRNRIRAVVVESSFHSYQEAAAGVFYRQPLLSAFTGFAYALTNDDYSPSAHVQSVSPIPLLVIHDVFDHVVSWRQGAAIYRLAEQPKKFWVTHRGGHLRAMDDLDLRRAFLLWLAET